MTDAPPPPPQYPYAPQPVPMNPQDEKTWATLTHVGGIFFGWVPALIVYLVLKDRGPFIRQHAATALNFQLTAVIATFASAMLMFALIGFVLLPAVAIVIVVFCIIAAVKANQGQWYHYPVSIKFVQE